MKRLACELKKLMGDTFSLYGELLKVMIPVMILVRLAVEFGAIEFVGKLIAPVMGWVGLPGEMGFVWVTAMIVNICRCSGPTYNLTGVSTDDCAGHNSRLDDFDRPFTTDRTTYCSESWCRASLYLGVKADCCDGVRGDTVNFLFGIS